MRKEEKDLFEQRKRMVYEFICDDMYVPMKIKEIADVTGLSETAVATRLQRAREKSKTYLEESGL